MIFPSIFPSSRQTLPRKATALVGALLVVLATTDLHAQSIRLWNPPAPGAPAGAAARTRLPAVAVHAAVSLPLPRNITLTGLAERVVDSLKERQISGTLSGNEPGTFVVTDDPAGRVRGKIMLPARGLAYDVSGNAASPVVVEQPLSDVICFRMPRPQRQSAASASAPATAVAPPVLNSRPAAAAALYIDFDGQTVTDPFWYGGKAIVAAASGFTTAQMTEVWSRVREDYLPFNVNVTTDASVYQNAAVGSRARCIVTPTSAWYEDQAGPVGGVAPLDSFADAGAGYYSTTVPCWVFITDDLKDCAEAVSHELGHTLGLHHDGRTSPVEKYYLGHGSGALGWAPIMGAGYYEPISQWSKGEYPSANDQEDDLAIISGSANGFGYAPSDADNSIATAVDIGASAGKISQQGFIGRTGEADYYKITTDRSSGFFFVTANPASLGGNLAASLRLLTANGNLVAQATPSTDPSVTLSANISEGTYYLVVQGAGHAASGSDYGFTNYASLGFYSLSGSSVVPSTSSGAPRNYQPDLIVGKGGKRVGGGQLTPEKQNYTVFFKSSKIIKLPIAIKNDGLKSDSMFVTSFGAFTGHQYRLLSGTTDITEKVNTGNYSSKSIAPGSDLNLTLEIRPSRAIHSNRKMTFKATSLSDDTKQDTVIVQLRPKKGKKSRP